MYKNFPKTRFQGSKYKLLPWLFEHFNTLNFETVLDGFSGSGAVSYLLKSLGKEVTSNDIMLCNYHIANAFIENNTNVVDNDLLNSIFSACNKKYDSFIFDNFHDIYFLDD